jgi:hypothetical protein
MVNNNETTQKEEMWWNNRRYTSALKQHKHNETTLKTRCVENFLFQHKKIKWHNDKVKCIERQKLKAKAKEPHTLHFMSK